MPGTLHESTSKDLGVPFIAEYFADLNYSPEGKLLITKTHEPLPEEETIRRVKRLLETGEITTTEGYKPIGEGFDKVTICVHSDTPGCVETTKAIRKLVDENNGGPRK